MNQAYHTPAISLCLMDNALLRFFTGLEDLYIETINHPLPKSQAQLAEEEAAKDFGWSFMVSSNILFGMAFLVCILLSPTKNTVSSIPSFKLVYLSYLIMKFDQEYPLHQGTIWLLQRWNVTCVTQATSDYLTYRSFNESIYWLWTLNCSLFYKYYVVFHMILLQITG